MKTRGAKILVFAVIIALTLCGGFAWRTYQAFYGPWGIFGRVEASRALLAKPENYKPAARAMARLILTDPALLKADEGEMPPA